MDKKKHNTIIDIFNASVLKDNFKILDSITFKINKKENTAIIGPNGSGKTSFLKLITRDYYPLDFGNSSYVKLFGELTWDLFELRSKIGIISDDLNSTYNKNYTGKEVVLSGFFSSVGIYSINKINKSMKERAKEIISFLEIEHLENKKLFQMSTGEVNRFLLGRALVNNPEILVLDEPTANLDIKATHIFLSYIEKLSKFDKTIILVTHNIHDIIPSINRIIMMKDGKIFKDGIKNDVLTNNNLSKLYDLKIEIIKSHDLYNWKIDYS